ncbi:MAG TPA: hypothetical protein VGO62_21020 [Myxococcota bacterium]|jgi:hypothetical protein
MQRAALQAEKDQAIQDGNLERAKELIEELKAIAPKSNGRSSSSVFRDPYDGELRAIYANKTVHQILGEYSKEVRTDFGFKGAVAGIVDLVDDACAAVGEAVSPVLEKELCRVFFAKFSARTHGMGMLFVERGNQVILKMYEHPEVVRALKLPAAGARPWLARKPLGDLEAEFARRWAEYEGGHIDAEALEAEDALEVGQEVKTAEPKLNAPEGAEQPSQPEAATAAAEEPTGTPPHPETTSAADQGHESQENSAEAATDVGTTEVATPTETARADVTNATEDEVDGLDTEPVAATAGETIGANTIVPDDSDAEMPNNTDDSNTDDSDTDSALAASPAALNFNDLLE